MQRSLLGQAAVTVYPVGNYTFGSKASKAEKDRSVEDKMLRLRAK
jgi:hypothetical protein